MSVAPAAAGQARRIGDILLELGFASEEALAKATIEHEKTGQPLGQILVEHGAITRMELASALAEQWSDQSASITLLPVPPPAPRHAAPRQPHDEDQYAARLQDAVAELAQRVGASQAGGDIEGRVTDLAQRVEATVARAQRIEATLAALADSLQGVTGGAEEALNALQTGMAGLALDLARVDATLAEVVAAPAETPTADAALAVRLDELAEAVQALAVRPTADESIAGRVDVLEGHAASLVEIRSALQELEARPVGSPEIDARLARIETELAVRPGEPVSSADVETLASRLDELGARLAAIQGELASLAQSAAPAGRVEELSSRLDEMAGARQAQESLAAKLDDVERRLPSEVVTPAELSDALARAREEIVAGTRVEPDPRIEVLGQELEAVRVALGTQAPDPELLGRLDALGAQVELLAGGVEAQAALAAKLDDVERRLPSNIVTLDDLSHALAQARAEIVAEMQVEPDPRIEQLAERLASDAQQQESLAAKLDDVERRLPSEVVTPAELSDALAVAREEIVAGTRVEPDPRIEVLGQELEAVRVALGTQAPDPELVGRLDALGAQVELLAGGVEAQAALAAKLDDVERRLPSNIVTLDDLTHAIARVREEVALESATGGPDPRIEELLNEVASLRTDHAPDKRVDVLVQGLESVRAELVEATAGIGAPDPELDRRFEALRVEQLAGDTEVADAVAAKLDELESRLPTDVVTPSELENALAEARAEATPSEPAGPDPRIDELAAGLVALRAELDAVTSVDGSDPRIDELAADLAALRAELDTVPAADGFDPALREEIAAVTAKLAAVEGQLPDDAVTGADVARVIDELRVELAAVEAPPPADTSALEETVSQLAARLQSLEGLAARVDGLNDALAAGMPTGSDPAQEEILGRLQGRVEELATTLEERLGASASAGPASSGDSEGLLDELERNRMTLERLGLHLGEHDRALAELMGSRNLPKRLDELAARVDELAAGGGFEGTGGAVPAGEANGEGEGKGRSFDRSARAMPGELAHEMKALLRRVEDAEIANSDDREKLMVRLERMASSIDWRLQRLEAPEPSE